MASPPLAINPSINANLPYDTFKALAPVALIARSFDIVVVNPKLPFMSILDVVAYAKASPGKLNFGSPGIGSSPHLAGEYFKNWRASILLMFPIKARLWLSLIYLAGIFKLYSPLCRRQHHMFKVDSCAL